MNSKNEQKALNCHYVSRFLTKPWESDERKLWYYDAKNNCISRQSSKSLLAKRNLNNSDMEHRLNELIETPLSIQRNYIATIDKLEVKEWNVFRAMVLMGALQASRTAAAHVHSNMKDLENFLELSEQHIDSLVWALQQNHQLVRLTIPNASTRLYFPSTGIFPFPVEDDDSPTGWTFGFGIPLTPYTVLAILSRAANEDRLREHIRQPGYLTNLTAGFGPYNTKVIVPPDMKEAVLEDELVNAIRYAIDSNQKLCESVTALDKFIRATFERFGLTIVPSG